MWNEIVARALVAERVGAANKAAHLRRMIAQTQATPDRSHQRRWGIRLPVHSAGDRMTSPGTTAA